MLPPRLLRTTWSRRNRNRFVFSPILSRLTQEEALADPALLIILADESVLGHIMAVPLTLFFMIIVSVFTGRDYIGTGTVGQYLHRIYADLAYFVILK